MGKRLVGVSAAIGLAAGGVLVTTQFVSGAGESAESVFISNTPCRLIDTRAGTENVGPVSSPIGPGATVLFNAHDGSDEDSLCEVPTTATAIAANVVAVAPTERSFLTLFPGGVENPGTANLNFVAGQAPTPNAAVIPLGLDGGFNVFNAFGTVDVVIDVSGFYQPSSNVGATGPAGGDLTGDYPNPTIADDAVNSAKIADATITQDDLAANSVGNGQLQTQVFFAKVSYDVGGTEIVAGSAGVSALNEASLGFPRIEFPQSMDICAITATTSAAAGTSIVRVSSAASGHTLQLAIKNENGDSVRADFNVIAMC